MRRWGDEASGRARERGGRCGRRGLRRASAADGVGAEAVDEAADEVGGRPKRKGKK